ncbi:hypothetical protein LC612_32790 [Nostoc sp. CHAB 5834]|nr:hypothetical protein [Nostoc sp. CHAB 5834]
MPKTWNLKIDNYFQANPNCIIATAHVDSFPIDEWHEEKRKSLVFVDERVWGIKKMLNSLTHSHLIV